MLQGSFERTGRGRDEGVCVCVWGGDQYASLGAF